MSNIISDRQYLASGRRKAKYVPYKTRLDSCTHEESDVRFGHPLYTYIADFLEISPNFAGVPGDGFDFPIIPDGCVSVIMILKKSEIRGYLCGVIDEIHKIRLHENEIAFIARYLPSGVRPFMREPISTYTNRSRPLSEVFSNYSFLLSTFAKSSLQFRCRLKK